MKIKLPTATHADVDNAKQSMLSQILNSRTDSLRCVKETMTSLAFLTTRVNCAESSERWPHERDLTELLTRDTLTDVEMRTCYRYILQPRSEDMPSYEDVVGKLIVHHAKCHIMHTYETVQLAPFSNRDAHARLQRILTNYSDTCIYGRTGDLYLHLLFRCKLRAVYNAMVPSNITPYEAMNKQYGDDVNRLESPYIVQSPANKILKLDWRDSFDIDGFNFIAGLLREMIDDNDGMIYINSQISQCTEIARTVPCLFAIVMDFDIGFGNAYGYVYGECMYIMPSTDQPLLDFFLAYIAACTTAGLQGFAELHTAVNDPDNLSASSPFNILLK